jgi:hypothetical protein
MRLCARPLLVLASVVAAGLLGAPASHASAAGERGLSAKFAAGTAWAAGDAGSPQPVPRAKCGPGSNPEPGMQGRVPAGSDPEGFTCNVELLGHEGSAGGFKVWRFVDRSGRECAYYDTTLLFPTNAQHPAEAPTGVAVLDMSDPSNPVQTDTLVTPAMQSPHESVVLNERRGLLAAVLGNPLANAGVVDVYDLNEDCRHPALQSSLPVGFLGHESGFAPDGNTFYATSLFNGSVTAVDVSNPRLPRTIWVGNYTSHGMTISEDGNRGYIADASGLVIVDLSEVQARAPLPEVREISRLTWDTLTIPQVAIPVTIGGRPHLVEIDEFSTDEGERFPVANGERPGVARIIDISDETQPRVVSEIRLEVHQPENRAQLAGDPGASSSLQGYAGHYCAVPQREEPGIVACSFIASGLRVFDIRDPARPREIAYFVAPLSGSSSGGAPSNYAMSGPAFAPERGEIWHSDGNTGFYSLRVAEGVWPFGERRPRRRRCVDRRRYSFKLDRHDGARVVKAVVYLNGERVKVRRGRDLRRVRVRRLPRRRFVVKIVTTSADGVRSVSRRTYRGCRKSRPRTRGVRPPRQRERALSAFPR